MLQQGIWCRHYTYRKRLWVRCSSVLTQQWLSRYISSNANEPRQPKPRSLKLDKVTGQVFDKADKKQQSPLFQAIIGLEIHAQLDIPTKLFSPASVVQRRSTVAPNSAVLSTESDANSSNKRQHAHPPLHPYDLAVPGYLPVLSKDAVQAAVLAAAILQCDISTTSRFERKHYAYPDLPFHYQITQQRWPLARNGQVEASFRLNPGKTQSEPTLVKCRVQRIQLEQDTGKTTITTTPLNYKLSCVDFNRAGQALIEIVLAPDLRTPLQAAAVTETLRQLLKHVGVCDGRMEEGSLRVDVNVNIEEQPQDENGNTERRRSPRCEVKNLNSLRKVREAVEFEVLRQAGDWDNLILGNNGNERSDDVVGVPETRTWNPTTRATELLRKKDAEQDYRFMPEPDLPPLVLNQQVLDGMSLDQFMQARIPELPHEAIERLQDDYDLTQYQARVVAGDPPAVFFLDKAIAAAKVELLQQEQHLSSKDTSRVHTLTTNLVINDLFSLVQNENVDKRDEDDSEGSVQDSRISPEQLGAVAVMLFQRKLSNTMAVKLLKVLYHDDDIEPGALPTQVAAERGMQLITDPMQLRAICNERIEACNEERELYIAREDGKFKVKMVKFFVGQIMSATKGNADPELLRQVLEEELERRFDEYHHSSHTKR